MITVIELESYYKTAATFLTPAQMSEIIDDLIINPLSGDLIPGTGGCRKVRYASVSGKGKSGGARIIYTYFEYAGRLYLLHIYKKSTQDNISEKEKRDLSKLVQMLKDEIHGKSLI